MKRMPDLMKPCLTATFFGHWTKTPIHFLVKKPLLIWLPVNTAMQFSWPIDDCINGVSLHVAVLLNLYSKERSILAFVTDETKLWLIPSAKQRRNRCCGSRAVYQNLGMCHDQSFKNAIDDPMPVRLKANTNHISGNSLSPLIKGPEQGDRHHFTDVTNQAKINH